MQSFVCSGEESGEQVGVLPQLSWGKEIWFYHEVGP